MNFFAFSSLLTTSMLPCHWLLTIQMTATNAASAASRSGRNRSSAGDGSREESRGIHCTHSVYCTGRCSPVGNCRTKGTSDQRRDLLPRETLPQILHLCKRKHCRIAKGFQISLAGRRDVQHHDGAEAASHWYNSPAVGPFGALCLLRWVRTGTICRTCS